MELDLRLGQAHSTQKPFTQQTHVDEPPVIQLDLLPLLKLVRRHSPPPQQLRFPCLTTHHYGRKEDAALMSSTDMKFLRAVKSEKDLLENKLRIKVETNQRDVTCKRGSEEEEDDSSGNKKLRLSKEQSAILEESFKRHHTINTKQKVVLAKQLSLRPRQVEVWFQNRRARTKLKQTRVNFEYLKRYCSTLLEENNRLKKELQQLTTTHNNAYLFDMHLSATALSVCPACGS